MQSVELIKQLYTCTSGELKLYKPQPVEKEERGEGMVGGGSQETIRLYIFSGVLAKKRETSDAEYARFGVKRTQIPSGCRFLCYIQRGFLPCGLILFSERQELGL